MSGLTLTGGMTLARLSCTPVPPPVRIMDYVIVAGGGGGGLARAASTSQEDLSGSEGVIMRHSVASIQASVTGSPTITTDGSYRYYIFTGSGTINFI